MDLNMDKLSHKPDVTKLLSMADNVVIRHKAHKRARHSTDKVQEQRDYGRLSKSVYDLAETAEKFRKAGQSGQP